MGWLDKRGWQDDAQARLSHQLSELQKETSALARAVARYGDRFGDDAEDFGEAVWHGAEAAAKQFGRELQRVGRAVRKDPLPAVAAVVALVGVVAALSLAFGRR